MTKVRLLLVDDEERFVTTTKALLERRGITTLTALSGVEAMKILDEQAIDVVLLDVKMPAVDGMEVLRKTKQNHPLVEVIMLTGHSSLESAVDGLKLGAFDYLTKPCDIPTLLKKINEACARKWSNDEKIRKGKVEEIIRHPLAIFDQEKEDQE